MVPTVVRKRRVKLEGGVEADGRRDVDDRVGAAEQQSLGGVDAHTGEELPGAEADRGVEDAAEVVGAVADVVGEVGEGEGGQRGRVDEVGDGAQQPRVERGEAGPGAAHGGSSG